MTNGHGVRIRVWCRSCRHNDPALGCRRRPTAAEARSTDWGRARCWECREKLLANAGRGGGRVRRLFAVLPGIVIWEPGDRGKTNVKS